jgi:hypothetical protein
MKAAEVMQAARRLPYADKRVLFVELARGLIGTPDKRDRGTGYQTGSTAEDIKALLIADIEMLGRRHEVPIGTTSGIAADEGDRTREP